MDDHAVTRGMTSPLDAARRRLSAIRPSDTPATIVCVTRHGYATTRVNVESMYRTAGVDFLMFYVDINSPPAAREFLEEQARTRDGFFHIRFDEYLSRQAARRLVLDLVPTPFTVFVDNNMLFADGWLATLLAATRDGEPAQIVSPLIVMQGGRVHFSGSVLRVAADRSVSRRQNFPETPLGSLLADVTPRRSAVDFGESHCCLVATDAFQGAIDELFPEAMHNAHTMCFATAILTRERGCRMLIEPAALGSILPIGAGYDIPWMFESYMDAGRLAQAYATFAGRIGHIGSPDSGAFRWHRKHLISLLSTMLERDWLERTTLLEPDEVPDEVHGYDRPLPEDAEAQVAERIAPFIAHRHPQYSAALAAWLQGTPTVQSVA